MCSSKDVPVRPVKHSVFPLTPHFSHFGTHLGTSTLGACWRASPAHYCPLARVNLLRLWSLLHHRSNTQCAHFRHAECMQRVHAAQVEQHIARTYQLGQGAALNHLIFTVWVCRVSLNITHVTVCVVNVSHCHSFLLCGLIVAALAVSLFSGGL